MTPTVGRIVHFQYPDYYHGDSPVEAKTNGQVHAAMIVDIPTSGDDATLQVFRQNQNGTTLETFVPRADEPTPGCWWWPERVA